MRKRKSHSFGEGEKMKRTVSVFLLLALSILCISSCGEKTPDLIGNWCLDATFNGAPAEISVDFINDTEGIYSVEGIKSRKFNYTTDNNSLKITLSDSGETEIPFSVSKGKLTVTYNGTDLIFTRTNDTEEK